MQGGSLKPSGPYLLELIPVSISPKPLGIFLLPLKWDASPSQGTPQHYVAGTHLYTWVERGTMRVKCLAQEHNTMTPGQASNPDRSIRLQSTLTIQVI